MTQQDDLDPRTIESHRARFAAAWPLIWTGDSAAPGYAPQVQEAYSQELTKALQRLGRRVAERHRAWLPVVGATLDDYRDRVLVVGGRHVLAGIRFKGGDRAQPFVDVVASEVPLADGEAVRALDAALRDAFAVFTPRWWRMFAGIAGTAALTYVFPTTVADQLLIGADAGAIAGATPPPHFADVAVRVPKDLEFYAELEREFAAFRAHSPIGAEVALESRASLDAALGAGFLRTAWSGDDLVGVIAAERGTFRGLAGVCMLEELLFARARGRGLGAAMQRRFIDALALAPDELVFGTIHHTNVASIRTALRVGRRELGRYLFVPCSGS